MTLSFQVGSEEHLFPEYFEAISNNNIKHIEVGSKFIMDNKKMTRIKHLLNRFNLSISTVYEFGHFQSIKKKEK